VSPYAPRGSAAKDQPGATVHGPGNAVGARSETPANPQADPLLTNEFSGQLTTAGNKRQPADDPIAQAEAALKAVRDAQDAPARQRAADTLEKALKRLKEQSNGAPVNKRL